MKGYIKMGVFVIGFFLFATSVYARSSFVDPRALELGKTYQISKRTPLMSQHDLADSMEVLKHVVYIEGGGAVKIIEVIQKNGTPWYKVRATNPGGRSLGPGWINSTALLDQNLQEKSLKDWGGTVRKEWGVIKYAHSIINIRAGRSTTSRRVGQLKPGEKVKVDFLRDNWYAVFSVEGTIRDEYQALGYVYAPLLKSNLPKPEKESK